MEKHTVIDMLEKKAKGCEARAKRYKDALNTTMEMAEKQEAELYRAAIKLIEGK